MKHQSSISALHQIRYSLPTPNPAPLLEAESSHFVNDVIDDCCLTLDVLGSRQTINPTSGKHKISNPLNLVQHPFQTPTPVSLSTDNPSIPIKYAIQHLIHIVQHCCAILHTASVSSTPGRQETQHPFQHLFNITVHKSLRQPFPKPSLLNPSRTPNPASVLNC